MFKNTILIVVFNYSNCIINKEFIKSLYQNHFKQIIFYSDIPCNHDDVHKIAMERGFFVYRVFCHFYKTYKKEIEESDGLFYTMDDTILNMNVFNLFDRNKIIYYNGINKPVETYSGWWWDTLDNGDYGKRAIDRFKQDPNFLDYQIDAYSQAFADWFYLPKKYLTDRMIQLFEVFSKHKIFLEIAVPTIIHHIEPDQTQYQSFTDVILWDKDREKTKSFDFIHSSFHIDHHCIVHPIKFIQQPETIGWLQQLFMKERCVIITTIHPPTESILKHIENKDYDVIIVGDLKTPDHYKRLRCIYLDVPAQKKLFPDLCEKIPYNHYSRKNLGYLYAIKKGYKVIYETDDDNIPYDRFDHFEEKSIRIGDKNKWINVFKYFTNNSYIWPRGFPLSQIKQEPQYSIEETMSYPSIVNGLVENDPDVDALFRLICNHGDSIKWNPNQQVVVDPKNMCLFNTQNTFWVDPSIFEIMFIPCSVSFRYCDILRSIIAHVILKKLNKSMMYTSPNVIQNRNEHNLMSDFKSEIEMYLHNETILEFIEKNTESALTLKDTIIQIYSNLLEKKVIQSTDVDLIKIWLEYF